MTDVREKSGSLSVPRFSRRTVLLLAGLFTLVLLISLLVVITTNNVAVQNIVSIVGGLSCYGATLALIVWLVWTICHFVLVMESKAPGAMDKTSQAWRRLIRGLIITKNRIPLVPLIILSATVPLVLVCLVFMIDLNPSGYRSDPARYHPWVWLLVILIIAGFQWFLWGSAKKAAQGDDN